MVARSYRAETWLKRYGKFHGQPQLHKGAVIASPDMIYKWHLVNKVFRIESEGRSYEAQVGITVLMFLFIPLYYKCSAINCDRPSFSKQLRYIVDELFANNTGRYLSADEIMELENNRQHNRTCNNK